MSIVVAFLVVGVALGSTGGAVRAVAGEGMPLRLPPDRNVCADLAIGVPFYEVGAVSDAGAVNVLFGSSPDGLSGDGSQLWDQTTLVFDGPEVDDSFGRAVAPGDFNGDGFADLAVGIPGESVGSVAAAGAVQIAFGTGAGLTATGSQTWHQDSFGIGEVAEEGDQFGWAVAAGDFNGDGFADLAVGVPFEDLDEVDAGAIHVVYGSAAGLDAVNSQVFFQSSSTSGDRFASALVAGDFDGDGFADLAIAAPYGDFTVTDDGAVHVLYGSADGLTVDGYQFWDQGDLGASAASGDLFGLALASGDFDGDGNDDLAVSAPAREVGSVTNAGVAYLICGSAAGLTATGSQAWSQNSPGVGGMAEAEDQFGRALAAGDLDHDGYADLAIGVPYENLLSGQEDEGCVNVLYGSASGLTGSDSDMWHQEITGVLDVAETLDHFGEALAIADFDGDGYADLAVGVPNEQTDASSSGAVSVLYGSSLGLDALGNQLWYQGAAGVPGTGGGSFGSALAVLPPPRAALFADDFESGTGSAWSTTVP